MDIIENINNDTDFITVNRSKSIMRAFDVLIKNENHTIGNLISDELQNTDSQLIQYASYKMPHPLEKVLILRVKINSETENLKQLKDETIKTIKDVLKRLVFRFVKMQYELKNKLRDQSLSSCFTDTTYDMSEFSIQTQNLQIEDDLDSSSSDSSSESDED